MQSAPGGRETSARIGIDTGRAEADRRIFIFVAAAHAVRIEFGDEEAAELSTAVERHKLGALQGRRNTAVVAICGRLEAELAQMEEKEAAELLESYGLKEPGLNRLIRATYDLMGLIPYFHGRGAGGAGMDDSQGCDCGEGGGGNS